MLNLGRLKIAVFLWIIIDVLVGVKREFLNFLLVCIIFCILFILKILFIDNLDCYLLLLVC